MGRKRNYDDWTKEDLIIEVERLKKIKTYGLVWEKYKTKENFDNYINWNGTTTKEIFKNGEDKFPVLREVKSKEIVTNKKDDYNILIEGDNYHSLAVLNFTHRKAIDLIYIDPPYNTGKKDFKYNDKWIEKEDGYRHSKWLSFMSKRLLLTRNLLKRDGIIIVHIDENEQPNLNILMNEIYGEKNLLGTIIWDKRNPKGDAQGIAYQHESIIIYANNRDYLVKNRKLVRPKLNSEIMIKKAKKLFCRLDTIDYPDDLKALVKKYKLHSEVIEKHKKKLTLSEINREFQDWVQKQQFTQGEKKYSKIDYKGRLYRLVSMAWPNKKKAPDDYFIPLKHSVTGKECPIPGRGWRYPPETMNKLLDKGLIEFGKDESTQPQRIYYLEENMFEKIPSILSYGGSDDKLLHELNISFENPKPVDFSVKLLSYFMNKEGIMLDCFAGSGSAGQALVKLNQIDGGKRTFILCTNDEGKICSEICFPRLEKIIKGYTTLKGKEVKGYGSNLKYYMNDLLDSVPTDQNKRKIVDKSTEMLCIKENAFDFVKEGKTFKIFKNCKIYLGILFDDEDIEIFVKEANEIDGNFHVYVFSLDDTVPEDEFRVMKGKLKLCPIPEAILHVYRILLSAKIVW